MSTIEPSTAKRSTTRLSGHDLFYEGAAYDDRGHRRLSLHGGTGGVGKGKCMCGALSPKLDSGSQRKRWHRAHKVEVQLNLDAESIIRDGEWCVFEDAIGKVWPVSPPTKENAEREASLVGAGHRALGLAEGLMSEARSLGDTDNAEPGQPAAPQTAPDESSVDSQAAADAEATFQLLAQHRQVNTIINPAQVECSCDAVLPLPNGNIDWPDAEHMALIRHHAEVLAAAKLALTDIPRQVTFSEHLRTYSNPAPAGWSNEQWHRDATLDSGTSHTLVGTTYTVQCMWCPEVFIGERKADAMRLFRAHEEATQAGRVSR